MSRTKITRTRDELKALLSTSVAPADLIPALSAAARDPGGFRDSPAARMVGEATAPIAADAHNMPQLTYTVYRDVQRYTNRFIYQKPRGEKYGKLTAVAMQVLLGHDDYVNLLHDYIWSICEETVWILPQREDLTIDLRVAGTAIELAEMIVGMEHKLEDRITKRVRKEIEERVFVDYLENHASFVWQQYKNNWSGVCNGGIGAAFLLLEKDNDRLAKALEIVLYWLQDFIDTAFAEDGTSEEGMGYWQYGLSNYVCFAEMLRIRTGGQLDLLDNDRLRDIARYPMTVMLSPGRFFAHSDCDEETALMPGIISRLAARTGVAELGDLLAEPASLGRGLRGFHTAWRDALWWDGIRPPEAALYDVLLPSTGTTRLVSETPSGASVVLAAKAGHNGVSHNHNDVGSFVLHMDGETLLCDPERGLYDNYNLYGKDNVLFSNSFGHSVPVIGGTLQSGGKEFAGQVTRFAPEGAAKIVEMELQGAYRVERLERVLRSFRLSGGELVLEDAFTFSGEGLPVEEAFVTWNRTLVAGPNAYIIGGEHVVQLTIEAPGDASFSLAVLKKESDENNKPVPLKRLSFAIPATGARTMARVRIKILG